ncbi:MAG: AAA family ATPase, partial [Candidatus Helarchaeota archaeon]
KYYLLPKKYLVESQTIYDYFSQSIEPKRMIPLDYDQNFIKAFFNKILGNLKSASSDYHHPSLSKILEDYLELIINGNYIHYIPDSRNFKKYNDMNKLEDELLSPDGENLAKFIASKKLNDLSWHEKFNDELKKFFDKNEEFSSKTEENHTYFYLREDELYSEFRLENMGRGMLNIALFIAFFLSINNNKIVLIEEPELHIFPGLQKKLRDKFLEFSTNNQIFISTHSPIFMLENQEIFPVYNIRKPEISSEVERIPNDELFKVFHDLDLSTYDFLLYDGILFVEGITDQKIFKIICANFFKENIKIIPIEGKRNLEHYASAKIINFLDGKKFRFLFILDKDRGNETFYERIEDPEVKRIIKERTIILPVYEIENLFIQPVLLLSYLDDISRAKLDKSAFEFLKDIIKDIFQELGENNTEYLLKKINDKIFPRLKDDQINLILKYTPEYEDLDELIDFWHGEYEKKITEMLDYYDNIKLNKEKFASKLKEIQKNYEEKFTKQLYHEIISGKKVFKKLRNILINRYKLSNFSIEDITKYITNLLKRYIIKYIPNLLKRSIPKNRKINLDEKIYNITFRRFIHLKRKFDLKDRELKNLESFFKTFISKFLIKIYFKMELNLNEQI